MLSNNLIKLGNVAKKYCNLDILAGIVLVVALIIRLWQLDTVPISLFGDELDVGNHANSILQLGRDYMGNPFPIYFQSFAEFRLPLQLYAAVPTIFMFGLNEWGVRLPAVIFGILSLAGFYYFSRELISKKIAFLGLLFLTISPWHLMYSRQANDAGMLPPFIIFGTLFFVKGRKNFKYLLASSAMFSLALYSYATSSVFVPLFVLMLVFLFRKDIFSYPLKKLAIVVILGLALSAPFLFETFRGSTTARFSYIGILTNDKLSELVLSNRKWSDSDLSRLIYNKKTIIFNEVSRNYLNSFSVTYLFIDGDPNLRQSIGSFGEFYQFDLILMIVGALTLVSGYKSFPKERRNIIKIMVVWLLLAPLPSSLTGGGGNHASRLILMMFPLILLSAVGADKVIEYVQTKKQYVLGGVLALFVVFNIVYFFQRYFVIWPGNSWRFWHYGFKQALTYAKENDANYDQVFINNTYEPMLPRFLFWYDYDMEEFHDQFTDDKQIEGIVDGYNGYQLGDKYYFGELSGITEDFVNTKRLVVASAEREISNPGILNDPRIKLLETVKSPVGEPIFYIFAGTEEPN